MKILISLSFLIFLNQNSFAQEQTQSPKRPYLQNPIIYAYPKNEKVTIDPEKLAYCMALVTKEEAPNYSLNRKNMSSEYHWGAFYGYLHGEYDFDDNVIDPATMASTRYKTGKEEILKSWILSQPDNSIDPISLYSESLKLNNGNVWNALLAMHDLLRNNGRYYHTVRYAYPQTQANSEKVFNKLIDIRGDLRERGSGFGGDHTGTWYRIWGVFLAAMMSESDKPPMCVPCIRSVIKKTADHVDGVEHFLVEEAMYNRIKDFEVSKNSPEETDAEGKIIVDKMAVRASFKFSDELWHPDESKISSATRQLTLSDCQNRIYLK